MFLKNTIKYGKKLNVKFKSMKCISFMDLLVLCCFILVYVGFISLVLGLIGFQVFCGWWCVNFWLLFAGKTTMFPWWGGVILLFIPYLNRFILPATAITWLFTFFI